MPVAAPRKPPAVGPRVRLRREPDWDHIPQTRRAKGKYQVRWHLRKYGDINCGLYDRELAVVVRRKLARETQHHADTPLGLWRALCAVLDGLRAIGAAVPNWVGPMYVRRREQGDGFYARVNKDGRRIELPGPFATEEQAHEAMVAHLRRVFPGWNRLYGRHPRLGQPKGKL